MVSVRTKGLKIDLVGNYMAQSNAYFSLLSSFSFLHFSLKSKFWNIISNLEKNSRKLISNFSQNNDEILDFKRYKNKDQTFRKGQNIGNLNLMVLDKKYFLNCWIWPRVAFNLFFNLMMRWREKTAGRIQPEITPEQNP